MWTTIKRILKERDLKLRFIPCPKDTYCKKDVVWCKIASFFDHFYHHECYCRNQDSFEDQRIEQTSQNSLFSLCAEDD